VGGIASWFAITTALCGCNVASRFSQAMKVGGGVMLGQGRMRVVRIARLMRDPDSYLLIVILLVKQ
jgi:hypothetical protein